MKKKYILESVFHLHPYHRIRMTLFSEEMYPYVSQNDSDWQKGCPRLECDDLAVKVIRNLWCAEFRGTNPEDRYLTDVNTGNFKKVEEQYYETFKHGWILDFLNKLRDENYKLLNLKSENEADKLLCRVLLNTVKDEPIEFRFKVEYNIDGSRT